MAVPIGVPGGGVWGRVQVGGGGVGFPVVLKCEKRGGEGGGVERGQAKDGQVDAHAFVKTTL